MRKLHNPKLKRQNELLLLIVDDDYQIGRTNSAGLCFLKTCSHGIMFCFYHDKKHNNCFSSNTKFNDLISFLNDYFSCYGCF